MKNIILIGAGGHANSVYDVILSTKKNNGKIEIIGSNDIKDVLKSKKNKHSKTNLNFQDLFIKQPLKNKPNLDTHKKKDELKDNVQLDEKNDNKDEITIDAFNNFKKEINNLLENMIITDSSTVSNSYDKSNLKLYLNLLLSCFQKRDQ